MKITALFALLGIWATSGYAQNSAFENQVHEAAEILRLPGYTLAVVKDASGLMTMPSARSSVK